MLVPLILSGSLDLYLHRLMFYCSVTVIMLSRCGIVFLIQQWSLANIRLSLVLNLRAAEKSTTTNLNSTLLSNLGEPVQFKYTKVEIQVTIEQVTC
jgi:hypothetical protein